MINCYQDLKYQTVTHRGIPAARAYSDVRVGSSVLPNRSAWIGRLSREGVGHRRIRVRVEGN